MYGRGWIKMGAGASFFFKNAGPVFKCFILLISICLSFSSRTPSWYSLQKKKNYKIVKVENFFLLQPGLLHAQQGGRGYGVSRYEVVEGHRPLQLNTHILDRVAPASSRVGMYTSHAHTPMYVGKTATATPWTSLWSVQPSARWCSRSWAPARCTSRTSATWPPPFW